MIEANEMDAAQFRASELSRRVLEYMRVKEKDFKLQDRFNRYHRELPPKDAVFAVLGDEQLDSLTAELLIKELGRSGSIHLALSLLDFLVSQSPSNLLSKSILDAALSVCCTHYLGREALRVYNMYGKLGIDLDVKSCNLAIAACSHGGDLDNVLKIIADMRSRGLQSNDFTLLMGLQTCMFKRRGQHEVAMQMFFDLSPPGRQPSAECLDVMLSVCEAAIDKAKTLSDAEAAFQALKKIGLHACTRGFNAIIKACAKGGAWQVAQNYFDEMNELFVPTCTQTFTQLIKACVRGGALKHALDIFEWMVAGRRVSDPIPADVETYNILIKACHQAGQLEKALEIMSWVQSSGVTFNDSTYEELIALTDIAEMWDTKALKEASETALAVFPHHLRPAKYDAMRMTYLEHLPEMRIDEALAQTKLKVSSWSAAAVGSGPLKLSPFLTPREASVDGALFLKVKSIVSPISLSRSPSMTHITLDNLDKFSALSVAEEGPPDEQQASSHPASLNVASTMSRRAASLADRHNAASTAAAVVSASSALSPIASEVAGMPPSASSPSLGSPLVRGRDSLALPSLTTPRGSGPGNGLRTVSRGPKSPSVLSRQALGSGGTAGIGQSPMPLGPPVGSRQASPLSRASLRSPLTSAAEGM
ncbi:hypothetical protein CEUSTIGMA_g3748.t1 [Chlamydomonas eustigma]|uniref:Pentacotripeptide-repeat region of PRORP domain-containing protein n=1 Tax=Chlamydomonas eustigma TaxID=1157962 RepID=A0A250WZN1_9CHLO|nr:hypothetical protein CEUSTIGMA_g3748.t1 [Chlamydomonas eustigma]|eukprot:GAX76303.1 hypothetical protein CEUSTIGMA_g3748.t1 [Chlamydomonas eustigma]